MLRGMTNLRYRLVLCVAAAIIGLAAPTVASTRVDASEPSKVRPLPRPEQRNITVAIAAPLALYMQTYLPEVLNYYKSEGLSVTIRPAGSTILTLVVSGQVQFGEFGAAAPLFPVKEGRSTAIVYANQLQGSGGIVVGPPRYTHVRECRKIATLAPGGAGHGNIIRYRRVSGASFDVLPVTDTQTKLAAVLSGQVDCAGGSYEEFAATITEGRLKVIVDTRNLLQRKRLLGDTYVEGVTFGLTDTIRRSPNTTAHYLRAKARAARWVKGKTNAQIAARLAKHKDFAGVPRAQLVRSVGVARSYLPAGGSGFISSAMWSRSLNAFTDWQIGLDVTDSIYDYGQRIKMAYYTRALRSLPPVKKPVKKKR